MSLINEALKRAKQAQEVAPPAARDALEFRTVEQSPTNRTHRNMLLASLAVVVLLAALLIWQMVQSKSPGTQARATERPTAAAPPQERVEAAIPAAPVTAVQSASPAVALPTAVAQEAPAALTTPSTSTTADSISEKSHTETATVAPEVVPPAKPPPPKLQSIVYNPTRPSAMINGRVVFVGDKFGEWRVKGIDQESATLVSGGVTNILVLQQ